MNRQMVGALLTVVLSAVPALAQERASLSDRQIRSQVEQRLDKKDIDRVAVGVTNGTVSLNGTVPNAWAKKTAVEQAFKVKDVVGVASNLSVRRAESDDALAAQIASKVRRYTRYTIFDDVNIEVDRGVATLTGRVTMPYKSSDIAELTSRVEGVQEVRNQIATLPVSIGDDRLRAVLARRIYRDPVLSNYAIQVNPPIHIIVENGNVTLTGAVASEVERVKAEMIVRSTFGIFNVDNQLQINP
jgi:hyperosmotically inducible periplasmic protein